MCLISKVECWNRNMDWNWQVEMKLSGWFQSFFGNFHQTKLWEDTITETSRNLGKNLGKMKEPNWNYVFNQPIWSNPFLTERIICEPDGLHQTTTCRRSLGKLGSQQGFPKMYITEQMVCLYGCLVGTWKLALEKEFPFGNHYFQVPC